MRKKRNLYSILCLIVDLAEKYGIKYAHGPWVGVIVEEYANLGDFWEKLFIKAKLENELELFCVALWLVWENRNKNFHEHSTCLPHLLADKAKKIMSNYRTNMEQRIMVGAKSPQVDWLPPPMMHIKVNTNAAYDRTNGLSRFGAVMRDHRGRVMASAVSKKRRS